MEARCADREARLWLMNEEAERKSAPLLHMW